MRSETPDPWTAPDIFWKFTRCGKVTDSRKNHAKHPKHAKSMQKACENSMQKHAQTMHRKHAKKHAKRHAKDHAE